MSDDAAALSNEGGEGHSGDALPDNPPVHVTRPYLPPLDEMLPLLREIWDRRWLTNHGPFHQRFEQLLAQFLDAEHVSLTANGMLALETALEASGLTGEAITTPYSFVATTHAIKRAGLTPVFVDVRASDLNMDADRIEELITERTSAIVAVHCYGNPCDGQKLKGIAERHGLKLIYDAAHAFGVRQFGGSVLTWGDFSILSFHATKAFNTFEGGAVIARSAEGKAAIDNLGNFGIADEVTVRTVGGNAKMNEFSAALGLVQLAHFEEARAGRRRVDGRYREALSDVTGIGLIEIPAGVEPNFSYFPVLVTPDYPISRDQLYERLKARGIYTRRYFHPLLSNFPMYRDLPSAAPDLLPVATRAAQQILCLPIYHDLNHGDQDRVIELIRTA
ncbi:MAG TPA: DegT/DnrJ/EryC1/StrS family aminotransferase [Sphingomicrobium sp.]|nr:DegT/DnrJ/EryC1/StrS family aminotransferase [Sphingomicrobium sp.]